MQIRAGSWLFSVLCLRGARAGVVAGGSAGRAPTSGMSSSRTKCRPRTHPHSLPVENAVLFLARETDPFFQSFTAFHRKALVGSSSCNKAERSKTFSSSSTSSVFLAIALLRGRRR